MADFLKNELIITLAEDDPAKLFLINKQISHLLYSEDNRKGSLKGHDDVAYLNTIGQQATELKKIIGKLFKSDEKSDAAFSGRIIPASIFNRVYIPYAYGMKDSSSGALLNELTKKYSAFAPIYDLNIILSTERPQGIDEWSIEKPLDLENLINKDVRLCYLRTKVNNNQSVYLTLTHTDEFKEIESGRARTYRIRFKEDVDVDRLVDIANNTERVPEIVHAERNYLFTMNAGRWEKHIGLTETGDGSGIPPITQPSPVEGPGKKPDPGRPIKKPLAPVIVAIVDSGVKLEGKPPEKANEPGFIAEKMRSLELRKKLPEDINTRIGGHDESHIFLDVVRYDPELRNKKGKGRKNKRFEPIGDGTVADNWPDDEIGHGTDLARIIVSMMGEKGCFIPIRAFYKSRFAPGGVASLTDICAGIDVAILAKADVINMSFSIDEEVPQLKELIESTSTSGYHAPCFIVSLGNDNNNCIAWPAAYGSDPNFPILGVGGAKIVYGDSKLERGGNTNYGKEIYGDYVLGPARDVDVMSEGGEGTSYAAAFVSGLAARIISILKASGEDWSREDVYNIIRESCETTKINNADGTNWYGRGLINVKKALALIGQ